jgi:hypothetical protein
VQQVRPVQDPNVINVRIPPTTMAITTTVRAMTAARGTGRVSVKSSKRVSTSPTGSVPMAIASPSSDESTMG